MPIEGLEPPWPGYKTGTLPLSEIDSILFLNFELNRIFLLQLTYIIYLALTGFEPV